MITFENIHLSLKGRPVLRGYNLQLASSQISLLIGPNGAGKSSALKVAAGLWKPTSGCIRFQKEILRPYSSRSNKIAYLPQSPGFHPRLRVDAILRFYARLENLNVESAHRAIERFGLDEHAAYPSSELSGGLRQRLGLAILSLSHAPVWLLDEPGLSLDPFWRNHLQSWLRNECDEGRTVLVATHLLREWENRADACHLCENGMVIGERDPSSLQGVHIHRTVEVKNNTTLNLNRKIEA